MRKQILTKALPVAAVLFFCAIGQMARAQCDKRFAVGHPTQSCQEVSYGSCSSPFTCWSCQCGTWWAWAQDCTIAGWDLCE